MSRINSVEKLRQEINRIDDSIIRLISERFKVVKSLGQLKQQTGITVNDYLRETKILQRLKHKSNGKIPSGIIEELYRLIFFYSRIEQSKEIFAAPMPSDTERPASQHRGAKTLRAQRKKR
jgi:chorismate mutase